MEHDHVVGRSGEQPVRSTVPLAEVSNPELTTIKAGGYSLATDLVGDPEAPPVVLLHGIPGWRGTWRPVAKLLAARAYIVAPDLAGFGESGSTPAHFHAAEQAEIVIALIRVLGRGPVHLVGFDFGGPVAVLVYARAPELVATLTLAATNVLTDTKIPLPLQLVRLPMVGNLAARLLFGRLGLTMMWFGAVARRDRFRLADYRAMLRFPQGITSTRRLFQASLRDLPGLYGPVHAALSGIQVPCTVVWGDRDPFFPTAVGERTATHIPGARFVQLKGCGHFLPAEDPGGFARVVEELVSRSTLTNGHVPVAGPGGSTAPVVADVG
jgi:pimeloyl-ACP methyl ester carboxylesterase